MTRTYLTSREFATLKAKLTRAIKSDEFDAINRVCHEAVDRFNATTWPDDWAHFQRAYHDACFKYGRPIDPFLF